MTISDSLKILELQSNANNDDLKNSYRSKAKMYHPDKHGGDCLQFSLINEAYNVLLDFGFFNKSSRNQKSCNHYNGDVKKEEKKKKVNPNTNRNQRSKSEPSSSHQVYIWGEQFKVSKNNSEKIKIIKSFVKINKKSSYPFLKLALYDSSEKIVMASIKAIGELKIIQAAPELCFLMKSSSKAIQHCILETVLMIGKNRAYMSILSETELLNSKELRKKAIEIKKTIYG